MCLAGHTFINSTDSVTVRGYLFFTICVDKHCFLPKLDKHIYICFDLIILKKVMGLLKIII